MTTTPHERALLAAHDADDKLISVSRMQHLIKAYLQALLDDAEVQNAIIDSLDKLWMSGNTVTMERSAQYIIAALKRMGDV